MCLFLARFLSQPGTIENAFQLRFGLRSMFRARAPSWGPHPAGSYDRLGGYLVTMVHPRKVFHNF